MKSLIIILTVAFSFCGCRDNSTNTITPKTTSETATFTDIGLSGGFYGDLSLSPDGSLLSVSFTPNINLESPKIFIYKTKDDSVVSTFTVPYYQINAVPLQFSLDNSKLLDREIDYADNIRAISLKDITTSTASTVWTANNPAIQQAMLYDDGLNVISNDSSGNLVAGSVFLHPKSFTWGFDRNENAVVYPSDDSIVVWNISGNTFMRSFSIDTSTGYFIASEDGSTIGIESLGRKVYSCYDVMSGKKIGTVAQGIQNNLQLYYPITLSKNYGYGLTTINGEVVLQVTKIADGSIVDFAFPKSFTGNAVFTVSRSEQYLALTANGNNPGKQADSTKIRIWKRW